MSFMDRDGLQLKLVLGLQVPPKCSDDMAVNPLAFPR